MNQSSKDFLEALAPEMNKKPADMAKFVSILEENWLETVEALMDVSAAQWSEMKFPMGLVSKINKKLEQIKNPASASASTQQTAQPQTKPKADVQMEEEIKEPVSQQQSEQIDTTKHTNDQQASIQDLCLIQLQILASENLQNDMVKIKASVNTLFKIINNIINSPLDPKFRKLPKENEAVRNKVLNHNGAVEFLKIAGFDMDADPKYAQILEYNLKELKECNDALNIFVQNLGGQVANVSKFDPYAQGVSSTTGMHAVPGKSDVKVKNVMQQIDDIKKQHYKALESSVDDRQIKVFNSQTIGQVSNINAYFRTMDQEKGKTIEQHEKGEQDSDRAAEYKAAIKLLAENEKNSKFRDKRLEELNKLNKQQVHTRSKIRIRFPDQYVLEGTFGALEKIQAVYDFVKQNIVTKEREFYLYETPPKRVLTKMGNTLHASHMVPSGLVYFGWKDLQETKQADGPFMDVASLKDKIISY